MKALQIQDFLYISQNFDNLILLISTLFLEEMAKVDVLVLDYIEQISLEEIKIQAMIKNSFKETF